MSANRLMCLILSLLTMHVSASSSFSAVQVNAAADRAIHKMRVPGAAVAVIEHGSIIYLSAFGVRRVGGAPIANGTRFEIGSLTKQFTAAAILQLQEQRKLSLDDHLSRYLSSFPHANEITLRQLLNQTTGLPDFMETNHFMRISQASPGGYERIARMVRGSLHFVPGSHWEYSNTNYIALGRVIEVVSHQRYESYISEHLFKPANMTHTSTVAQESMNPEMATGYWRGMSMKGHLTPAPVMKESWAWSAGDIVSTAGDIARWDIALEEGTIVHKADFALMTQPPRLSDGKRDDYAFHWWTDPLQGHRLFSGLGDTFGFSSCNDLFPDDDLAIVVLANAAVTPDGDSDAAASIAAAIFESIAARDSNQD